MTANDTTDDTQQQQNPNLVLSALLGVIGKAAYSLRRRHSDKSGKGGKWCVVCGEPVTDEGCGCERLGV